MKRFIELIAEAVLLSRNYCLELIVSRPPNYRRGEKHAVIIPGFNDSWVFMRTIASDLNNNGYQIHSDWGFGRFTSIPKLTLRLADYLDEHDLHEVVLVGYSKGGLVAANLLSTQSAQRVSHFISIATPFHGSVLAYPSLFNLNEMYLGKAEQFTASTREHINHLNLYPVFDQFIIPSKSLLATSEGVKNQEIQVTGHTRILEDFETRQAIASFLRYN